MVSKGSADTTLHIYGNCCVLNVSAGTVVSSNCTSNVTALSGQLLQTIPTVSGGNVVITNTNGVTRHTITFVAPPTLNSVIIGCFVAKGLSDG